MNVLLVGEESAGIQTLKALARSDHRIVAVMASPAPGTVRRLAGPAVQVACANEWIWVDKALIEGKCLPAADILQPGARLDNGIFLEL